MRLHLWSILSLVGAIASSIPLSTAHELHLPYLPSLSPEHDSDAYLFLKWTVTNGSLYANNDQIFPPTIPMQLHAPQFKGQANARVGEDDLELSYSLHARPLSSKEAGATSKIVRVRVDLMDFQGEPVTPNAVVLDLLAHPDGGQRVTRIQMEPGKGHREGHDRPWHMKFWQTQMAGIINHTDKLKENKEVSSPVQPSRATTEQSTQARPSNTAQTDDIEEATQVGFIFSPYWSPSAYSHRGHGHGHPHRHDCDRTFMRLARPVILPAILGAAAGLVVCLVGFIIGYVCMLLSVRLGLHKNKQHRRSSDLHLEDGTCEEKSALMVPENYMTDSDSDA
ncbi:hypothetical protein N7499_003721 [Penicillium canescens]|uniref:Uncharacterized protein n=1 Tax=Penicillium canescens TaxID=5083 RepID=A0AAD6N8Q2_PENCN|nr:uncharacterized protein N7446_012649 [Penicillium canescens]KAJ6018406.1 hypothetical protein N7522_001870 [Penicillium canescens]KAJ6038837.1 hypothetical protein N7460_007554 [Penicillium canescens]KAJ6045785.1 hypothetical protein N7446_012649 [Penicillium canescens]KAJ6066368.1 hypothetical protein N7444_000121 [Penicillium canescens]KAJ6091007.1 hypothetical protein N7499_003721 [Penicillium canescens]